MSQRVSIVPIQGLGPIGTCRYLSQGADVGAIGPCRFNVLGGCWGHSIMGNLDRSGKSCRLQGSIEC